LGTYPRLVCR